MRRLAVVTAAVVAVVAMVAPAGVPTPPASAAPVTAAADTDRLSAYRGLASWVDIYDERTFDEPVTSIRRMHANGVRTVFIETANYHRPARQPIFRPKALARMINAAHRRDMQVVAWYLPGFRNLKLDYRRAMAAIRFTTPTGHRFDSFALDIEATVVRDIGVRNRRMNILSKRLRSAVGPDYTLGAIVPEANAKYWPGFPYKRVARRYDVFLPMAYFTFRTSGEKGARRFIGRNIRAVREATGNPQVPVHIIGGLTLDATLPEIRGFVDAVLRQRPTGASLYEFETTTDRHWRRLRRVQSLRSTPAQAE